MDDNSNDTIAEYVNDALITAKIKAKLEKEDILNIYKIHVETNNNGVVFITSQIDDIEIQRKIKEIAEKTENVRKVFTNWEQEAILD